MSKMSELDMDRQRVERLTDVVRPPTFAESARAGYREITRADINAFLRSAVILAMAKPEYINGGVRACRSTTAIFFISTSNISFRATRLRFTERNAHPIPRVAADADLDALTTLRPIEPATH